MLRKAKLSLLTAFTTALSALTSLSVSASPIQTPVKSDISVIPASYTRAYAGTSEESLQIASTTSDDFKVICTEPEESTIPHRDFTVTTVAPADDTKGIFPIKKSRDIKVKVVDYETGEHIDGVRVNFFETENPTSNQIKRDLGSWWSTDSETFTLHDVDYTLERNDSMFLLTAVLDHIPHEYSYSGRMYGGAVIDHVIDVGEWYANGEYIYYNTDTLIIKLDKAYKGTFNAECSVINSVTGELIEGAEVALKRRDSDGYSQPVDMWHTEGNTPHITKNLSYIVPNNYTSELWELVIESLPDGYNNTSKGISCGMEINADTPENVEFKIYVDPDGNQVNTTIYPPQYTTTIRLCGLTTTQTTVAETRTCDSCGNAINVFDGITAPSGMFLCINCRTPGMGGTCPPYPLQTYTATQTTVAGGTYAPLHSTNITTSADGLYHGKFQAMCFAIDAVTGKKVSGAELQLFDETGHIIESWDSSEKCGHQIDIDYTMDSADSYKTYQLSLLKLPEGYTYSGILDQTAEGLISDYHKIDCGFNGIVTFAFYVISEDYAFPETGVKPWQTTRALESITTTTAINSTSVAITATTLAIGKINLNSVPKKTNYKTGEKLDLTGLDVSMTHELGVNGKDGVDVIFNHVNPADYPEAFIVNTHDFDSTKAGTYTIKVKCTDDYKSDYTVMDNIVTFEVTVSDFSDLIGDANESGDVNISDAVLIMQSIANPEEYKISRQGRLNADVYNRGDGITCNDALVLQMIETKTISSTDLPVSNNSSFFS